MLILFAWFTILTVTENRLYSCRYISYQSVIRIKTCRIEIFYFSMWSFHRIISVSLLSFFLLSSKRNSLKLISFKYTTYETNKDSVVFVVFKKYELTLKLVWLSCFRLYMRTGYTNNTANFIGKISDLAPDFENYSSKKWLNKWWITHNF